MLCLSDNQKDVHFSQAHIEKKLYFDGGTQGSKNPQCSLARLTLGIKLVMQEIYPSSCMIIQIGWRSLIVNVVHLGGF